MKRTDSREDRIRGTKDFPVESYHVNQHHPRYLMSFHWHFELEIMIMKSGSFSLRIEDEPFELMPGDIVFIGPGLMHGGIPHGDAEYDCVVFDSEVIRHRGYRDDSFIADILSRKISLSPCIRKDVYKDSSAMQSVLRFLSDYDPSGPGYELYLASALKFILAFYEEHALYMKDDFIHTNGQRRADQMRSVIEYIDMHFAERITLEELSSVAGLSSRYFCSFFREFTGRTCFDYVNSVKIEKAVLMLESEDMSISEIAYASGFDDCSYFSRLFRRYMNESPREYRKSYRCRIV